MVAQCKDLEFNPVQKTKTEQPKNQGATLFRLNARKERQGWIEQSHYCLDAVPMTWVKSVRFSKKLLENENSLNFQGRSLLRSPIKVCPLSRSLQNSRKLGSQTWGSQTLAPEGAHRLCICAQASTMATARLGEHHLYPTSQ